MCEPVSITLASLAVAGGAAKGIADKKAADAAASAERRNAAVAEAAAADALVRGEQDAGRIQMQGSAVEGKQRAGLGAMGVDVNLGSAARAQEDTAALTAVDVEQARNNAQREAWGLKTQAANMENQATRAENAGNLAFATDIIGGVAGAAAAGLQGLNNTGYFSNKPKPPGTP